jgi:hypothetical protein
VVVNGQSMGPVSTYTFNNISANGTIAASFGVNTHTITAAAGTGGTITPSGSIPVTQGGNQTFTISAHPEYRIKGVSVDGNSVGPVSTYTFTAVSRNHSITAAFERLQNDSEPGTTKAVFGNTPDAEYSDTVQDTFINIDNQVYVDQTQLNTYTWPTNTPANAVLIKFDLSQLPPGAQVQSATLRLYQIEAGGDDAYDVSVHKVINHNPDLHAATGYTCDGVNNWTANKLSHRNIPLAQADIAPAEDVNQLDRNNGYKNWNVTDMVQDWVSDSASNYGLMLNSSDLARSKSFRYFASSKAVDAAVRPILEVTYTGPTTTTENVIFGNTPDADHPGTVQDTFLNINTKVNVALPQLNTYTWPANTPANAVLIKFDLSQLPPGARIQSAILTLYQIAAGGDDAYDVSAHKVINHNPDLGAATGYTYNGVSSWTDNSVSYNNIPLAQADISPAEDVNRLDANNGYKSWDVTGMVQVWANDSASNYGLLLNSGTLAGADSFRYFASSEADDAAVRPLLEITYTIDRNAK